MSLRKFDVFFFASDLTFFFKSQQSLCFGKKTCSFFHSRGDSMAISNQTQVLWLSIYYIQLKYKYNNTLEIPSAFIPNRIRHALWCFPYYTWPYNTRGGEGGSI